MKVAVKVDRTKFLLFATGVPPRLAVKAAFYDPAPDWQYCLSPGERSYLGVAYLYDL